MSRSPVLSPPAANGVTFLSDRIKVTLNGRGPVPGRILDGTLLSFRRGHIRECSHKLEDPDAEVKRSQIFLTGGVENEYLELFPGASGDPCPQGCHQLGRVKKAAAGV